MAKTPPDFNALFFSSLGGKPGAISLSLRDGPNLLHDLAFMNGLLHDAHILNRNAQAKDGVLALRFDRDCWELGQIGTANQSLKMHVVESTLTCNGVLDVEWAGEGMSQAELWMNHLWISRQYLDPRAVTFTLSIVGDNWACDVALDRDRWMVALQDEAVPQLR